eukprot:753476-Hanusia_phi.AAC.1
MGETCCWRRWRKGRANGAEREDRGPQAEVRHGARHDIVSSADWARKHRLMLEQEEGAAGSHSVSFCMGASGEEEEEER